MKKATKLGQRKKQNRPARKKMAERRLELRSQLWPNSDSLVWNRKTNDGYSTIPRLLPLISVLIKELSDSGDPTAVYNELWARQMDDGMIEVLNEEDMAYSSGYTGNRARRTWRERIDTLSDLGFIQVKPKGSREYGYILLLNPYPVIRKHHSAKNSKVSEEWWNAYIARADEIGANI